MKIECGQTIALSEVDTNSAAVNNIVQFKLSSLLENRESINLYAFCPHPKAPQQLWIRLKPATGFDLKKEKELAEADQITELEKEVVSYPVYKCSKSGTSECPLIKQSIIFWENFK